MDDYVLTRTVRQWVPAWLWRLAKHWWPTAHLLTEHTEACECACHQQPGMRACAFCGWRRG